MLPVSWLGFFLFIDIANYIINISVYTSQGI